MVNLCHPQDPLTKLSLLLFLGQRTMEVHRETRQMVGHQELEDVAHEIVLLVSYRLYRVVVCEGEREGSGAGT